MCGEGVRRILLLPLVVRCIETIDVCIWRMFVLCMLLLFAFQYMFISIWVSRLEIAEFPEASVGLLHRSDGISVVG